MPPPPRPPNGPPPPPTLAADRASLFHDPSALSADQAFKRDMAAKAAKKPHVADVHTFARIPLATRFVVFFPRGRGLNNRDQAATLAEARAIADGDPRALIYAIPPDQTSAHVLASYPTPAEA